jgi:hypothetical protein
MMVFMICNRCETEKSLKEFYLRDKIKMIYRKECKACVSRRNNEHHQKTIEKYELIVTEKLKYKILNNIIINRTNDCWEWTRCLDTKGYARIYDKCKPHRGSRISYLVFKGKISDGMMVCHLCDNRKCVNPEHLWLGTNEDNMKDKMAKGRWKGTTGLKWAKT